jgi:hypothetical protein
MKIELRVDGEIVIHMDVNAGLLAQLLSMNGETATIRSTPITATQAERLLASLDKKNAELLKRIASNDGWITWGEMKQLFGVKDWTAFQAGPGREIAQALRDLLNNKSAVLIWRNESEWEGLDEGAEEVCKAHVDGAALVALREAAQCE